MLRRRTRFIQSSVVLVAAVSFLACLPSRAFAQCGNCSPGTMWEGVSDGNYKFDSSVSNDVQQAALWADDGWGSLGHDQNDPNAITITTYNDPNSPETGHFEHDYGTGANTIAINLGHPLLANCSGSCNPLVSVIAHEMGHALGFDNIEAGCETSIMSWDRDRSSVIGPSSEDLCWYWNNGEGGGGDEGGCLPYCLDQIYARLRASDLDDDAAIQRVRRMLGTNLPASWRQVFHDRSLIAVIKLTRRGNRTVDISGVERQLFEARVLGVLGGGEAAFADSVILVELDAQVGALPPNDRSLGSTFLALLDWNELSQSYVMAFQRVRSTQRRLAAAGR